MENSHLLNIIGEIQHTFLDESQADPYNRSNIKENVLYPYLLFIA